MSDDHQDARDAAEATGKAREERTRLTIEKSADAADDNKGVDNAQEELDTGDPKGL